MQIPPSFPAKWVVWASEYGDRLASEVPPDAPQYLALGVCMGAALRLLEKETGVSEVSREDWLAFCAYAYDVTMAQKTPPDKPSS